MFRMGLGLLILAPLDREPVLARIDQRPVAWDKVLVALSAGCAEIAKKGKGPADMLLVRIDIVVVDALHEARRDQRRAAVALDRLPDGVETVF